MSDIVYRNSQVVVSDPGVGKVIVYPRLSDKIKFDLDLKNLRSYIVGRDLIIETYSGGKIVIANYALLFAENNQIEIVDSNGIAYKMDDFIGETVASLVSNESCRRPLRINT